MEDGNFDIDERQTWTVECPYCGEECEAYDPAGYDEVYCSKCDKWFTAWGYVE